MAALIRAFAFLAQGKATLAEVVRASPRAAFAILFAECAFLDATHTTDARCLNPAVAAVVVATAGAAWLVAALTTLAASNATALAVVAARFACLVATARILWLTARVAIGSQGRA